MTLIMPGGRNGKGGGGDERARNWVRVYRGAAGLTQQQLADAAGISIGVIRDLERGRTARIRTASADALIGALGLDGHRAREFAAAVLGGAAGSCAAAGADQSAGLQLSVLGPLAARRDGAPAPLGPPMQRAVLALLALSPDRLVHREALIDALWGADPPATAVNQVQANVGRIRWALDPARPPDGPASAHTEAGSGSAEGFHPLAATAPSASSRQNAGNPATLSAVAISPPVGSTHTRATSASCSRYGAGVLSSVATTARTLSRIM
jgi:transcriptional regulator with XRE-family HTH domain